MEKYICDVCGWEYDPAVGDPENGIEPGTAFEDLPEDWVCPLCGVGKDQFSPAQETGFQIKSIGALLHSLLRTNMPNAFLLYFTGEALHHVE